MMTGLDHFKVLTPEDIQKKKVELEAISKRIKAIGELGSECLGDKKFTKYRSEFERLKETLLDFMISYANPDPIQDAFFLRASLNQMKILKLLLDSVKKDARRKVK